MGENCFNLVECMQYKTRHFIKLIFVISAIFDAILDCYLWFLEA